MSDNLDNDLTRIFAEHASHLIDDAFVARTMAKIYRRRLVLFVEAGAVLGVAAIVFIATPLLLDISTIISEISISVTMAFTPILASPFELLIGCGVGLFALVRAHI